MRFSDIIASLDISTWPQAALVIFVCVFLAVSIRLLGRERVREAREASMLPLDDGTAVTHAPAQEKRP
ncbi:MAG: hypothetical protein RL689_421 [Planctomycetota bacterium]|jgi:hypothetical protein